MKGNDEVTLGTAQVTRFDKPSGAGYAVGMNQTLLKEGDLIKVTSGIYEDVVGVVTDIQPECSVIRIHSKSGTIYSYAGHARPLVLPASIDNTTTMKALTQGDTLKALTQGN